MGMALSVVLLLFFILESGIGGDPSLRMAGKRPSPQRILEARLHLGLFEQLEPEAARLQLQGTDARIYLEAPQADLLRFLDVRKQPIKEIQVPQQNLSDFLTSLHNMELSPGIRLAVIDNSDDGTPAPRSAKGVCHAMTGLQLALSDKRPTALAWALPRPAWKRFLSQTTALLRLDFGRSMDGQNIASEMTSRGARSLALTFPAMLLSTLAALFCALWMASRRGFLDRSLTLACSTGMAITSLAWVLFLRNLLAGNLEWFPVAGWDAPYWRHLALPVCIWALLVFFPSFLLYRALFLLEKDKSHFVTARAKGLNGWTLLFAHLARPVGAPLISQWVLILPFLVTGSLLLERIFVIPGLGSYVVDAAVVGDAAILRSVTFVIAIIYICFQWLGEWLTAWVDPRTREGVQT
jgi:peptide/nickel transport system permease protein